MSPAELERYLHEHIPLSSAMAVSVDSAGKDSVVLRAPLAPNINHRDTVFGGSASALAILSAWSLLHIRTREEGIDARLVIQRNTMEYTKPIVGEFIARSALSDSAGWQKFTRFYAKRGIARIVVNAELEYKGGIAGNLNGEFVALSAS